MIWEPDSQDPGKVTRSVPERFVIVMQPSADQYYWLTDLASNAPPNPPTGYGTLEDAKRAAEDLELVYTMPESRIFHRSLRCPSLNRANRYWSVTSETRAEARKHYYAKVQPCKLCAVGR